MQHQPAGYPSHPAVAPPTHLPHYLHPDHHYFSPNPNPAGINPYAASAAATSAQTYIVGHIPQPTVNSTVSGDITLAAGNYQDPRVQNWTNSYVAGVATNATQQSVASQVKPISWKILLAENKTLKKRKNPAQPAWCDVCKIECTSKELLNMHKQGKKHQKNLEKLKVTLPITPCCEVCKIECTSNELLDLHKVGKKHLRNLEKLKSTGAPVPDNSIISPPENPEKRKLKEPEDLEMKKKKVVDGGAAVSLVRTCEICNVVCNSDDVFKSHIAGKKHVARSIMLGAFAAK